MTQQTSALMKDPLAECPPKRFRRRKVLLGFVLLFVAIQAWQIVSAPAIYHSSGTILVAPESNASSLENFYGTQLELMQSNSVRRMAEARIQTLQPELIQVPIKLTVALQPETSVIKLQANGSQPAYTEAFLQAIMESYIESNGELVANRVNLSDATLSEKLKSLEKQVADGEKKLSEIRIANNVDFLKVELVRNQASLTSLDEQLTSLKVAQLLLMRPSDEALGAALGPDYTHAEQELDQLKSKLAQVADSLRPQHPIVVELNQKIAEHERLIQGLRENSADKVEARQKSIALEIKNLSDEREKLSKKMLDLTTRMTEVDTAKAKVDRCKALYDKLWVSAQEHDLKAIGTREHFKVIENATTPNRVPKKFLWPLLGAACRGLLTGFAALIALAVFRRWC